MCAGYRSHLAVWVMRTAKFVAEMTSRLKGIGGTEGGAVRTPRINVVDLLEIRVAVPGALGSTRVSKLIHGT